MNKELKITIDPKGQATITAEGLIFPEVVRAALTIIETAAKQTLSRANADFRPTLAEDMFELINVGASSLLNRVFPEIALRPDLTAEAIQEAQDRLVQEDPAKTKAAQDAFLKSGAFIQSVAERKAVETTLNPNPSKAKLNEVINNVAKKRISKK